MRRFFFTFIHTKSLTNIQNTVLALTVLANQFLENFEIFQTKNQGRDDLGETPVILYHYMKIPKKIKHSL